MDGKLFAQKYYRNIQAAGWQGYQEFGRGAALAVLVNDVLETIRYIIPEDLATLPEMPGGYLDTLTSAIQSYDPKTQTVLLYVAKKGNQASYFATVLKDTRTTPEKAYEEIKHLAGKMAGIGRKIGARREKSRKR